MSQPEFTAEWSVYTPTKSHATTHKYANPIREAVVPALAVTYCRNTRPGWVIDATLCGECAVFTIRCQRRTCSWVQLTPWKTECWNDLAAEA